MKKLKYMSMMGLAALLLTTWAACSDDTDASGGENPEEARAYTTVTIAVPNGVAETRASDPTADTDGTSTETGLKDEYKVTKANLYLFPGGTGSSFGSAKLTEIISISQFTQTTTTTTDQKTIVWTSKKTALTPGDYRIYIVVNGTVNGVGDSDKGTLTEADFLAKTTADATSVIAAVPNDGLVMASRSPNNDNSNTLPYIAQEITKEPEQTIAATVERVMGKITVTAGGTSASSAATANKYTSFSTTVAQIDNIKDITLKNYYVVNARKEGYYFRHVDKENSATNPLTEANYGNSSATLPYVTDPIPHSLRRPALLHDLPHDPLLLHVGGQPGADPAEDRHQHQTGQDGPVQRILLRHPFGEDQVRAGGVDQHGRQFQFYQHAEYQQDQEHGQDEKEHLLCQCQIPKHKKSSSICFEIYGFSYEYYLIFQKTCQKIHFRGDSNMEIKIPMEELIWLDT